MDDGWCHSKTCHFKAVRHAEYSSCHDEVGIHDYVGACGIENCAGTEIDAKDLEAYWAQFDDEKLN